MKGIVGAAVGAGVSGGGGAAVGAGVGVHWACAYCTRAAATRDLKIAIVKMMIVA